MRSCYCDDQTNWRADHSSSAGAATADPAGRTRVARLAFRTILAYVPPVNDCFYGTSLQL
jgi:hypothetical protein